MTSKQLAIDQNRPRPSQARFRGDKEKEKGEGKGTPTVGNPACSEQGDQTAPREASIPATPTENIPDLIDNMEAQKMTGEDPVTSTPAITGTRAGKMAGKHARSPDSDSDTSLDHKQGRFDRSSDGSSYIELDSSMEEDPQTQEEEFTQVNKKNRKSHGSPTPPPRLVFEEDIGKEGDRIKTRDGTREGALTFIMFSLTGGRRWMEGAWREFSQGFTNYVGQVCETRVPTKSLGLVFRIPAHLVDKAKQYAHPRLHTIAPITAKTMSELDNYGRETSKTKSKAHTQTSYAVLRPHGVRIEHLNKMFDPSYSIKTITPITVKGKEIGLAKIQFESELPPLELTDKDGMIHTLEPCLLSPLRCTKCQKFGHSEKNCRNKVTVCPYCAGAHTHKDCKRRNQKKCANCGLGGHGAAYKGCLIFKQYQAKIAELNRKTSENWNNRVQTARTHAHNKNTETQHQTQQHSTTQHNAPHYTAASQQAPPTHLYTEKEVKSLIKDSALALLKELNKHGLLATKPDDFLLEQIAQSAMNASTATSTSSKTNTASTASTNTPREQAQAQTQSDTSTKGTKNRSRSAEKTSARRKKQAPRRSQSTVKDNTQHTTQLTVRSTPNKPTASAKNDNELTRKNGDHNAAKHRPTGKHQLNNKT